MGKAILGPWRETEKFIDFTINYSIISLPCSAQEKCYVLVYVVVASIDRGTDHFCCFAPGPEIAFPFAVCKENNMLTEWGTSRVPTRVIMPLARQLQARWESPKSSTWLTICCY